LALKSLHALEFVLFYKGSSLQRNILRAIKDNSRTGGRKFGVKSGKISFVPPKIYLFLHLCLNW